MPAVHVAEKTLHVSKLALVRYIEGAVAAESGTLDEATYPVATVGFNCAKYDTVLVGVKFTSADAGTVTLEAHAYDEDTELWLPILDALAAPTRTPALTAASGLFPLKVYGRNKVFFRIHAKTNTVSALEVFAMPGDVRFGSFF